MQSLDIKSILSLRKFFNRSATVLITFFSILTINTNTYPQTNLEVVEEKEEPTSIFDAGFGESDEDGSVELNGDIVEYSADRNIVIIKGNVIIIRGGMTLYADYVEFSRDTSTAKGEGNVRLVTKNGEISGEKMSVNFETMTGEFHWARLEAYPYYGGGARINKVSDNKFVIYDGYMTTSDFDKPEYRIRSKKIEFYPGDKMIARHITPMIGNQPVMYFPRLTQNLKDSRSKFLIIPGSDKDWGLFALAQYRYFINDNLTGTLHLDYRSNLGTGGGLDLEYTSAKFGDGLIRLYYLGEKDKELTPVPDETKERFKGEWRHNWDINDTTTAIWQYYKLSDNTLLKRYFEKEFEEDSNPRTFFNLIKSFSKSTLSLLTVVKVNQFESRVERLPELRYDFSSTEIGDTGLFFRNTSSVVYLRSRDPTPSEVRKSTTRIDMDNEISYPMKVSFIEFKPFFGKRFTFYKKTKEPDDYESVRHIFRVGADLSTKFYRIYDVTVDRFGLEVNRLRHIITPSVAYEYVDEPTVTPDQLDSFDGIDGINKDHNIRFELENKLQTKRNGKTVELLRTVVGVDYKLKEAIPRVGFATISYDMDIRPTEWLTLYFDTSYDTRKDHLTAANFDFYINNGEKWKLGIGGRYQKEDKDQLTTEFTYRFNPKWAFRLLHRVDIGEHKLEEQEYTLTRDLHAWEMDININDKRGHGSEFILVFRLKAFPSIGFDASAGFNKRKSGSGD